MSCDLRPGWKAKVNVVLGVTFLLAFAFLFCAIWFRARWADECDARGGVLVPWVPVGTGLECVVRAEKVTP